MRGDFGNRARWVSPKMVRTANGQLRDDNGKSRIDEIWAQQRRIQMQEARAEKEKRAASERLRKERGIVGFTKDWLSKFIIQSRKILFGERPKALARNHAHQITGPAAKTVEIKLRLPSLPKLASIERLKRQVRKLPKKITIAVAGLCVIAIAALIAYHLWVTHVASQSAKLPAANASSISNRPVPGTPAYATLLPAGKSIAALGGWYRVSPPGRDPVYAYSDTIGGIQIDVSEQPLPKSFQANTAEAVAQLAQGFNADQKLAISGSTAYIGTSAKGPQSVIFTKNNLLILIKSDSIITNDQWIAYTNALR